MTQSHDYKTLKLEQKMNKEQLSALRQTAIGRKASTPLAERLKSEISTVLNEVQ